MTDLPPPVAPGPPAQPYGPAEPNAGMPLWGILVIVGTALAVGVISFLVILGLTSLGASPQAGGGQPGTDQQESGQPAAEEPDAEEPDAGVTHTSEEFGYEVALPGEATEITTPQSVAGYDLEIVTASWASGDRNVSVNATAFPDELYAADATDEMLQGSLEGAATSVGGTLENVEFVDIQGERGISGVIRAGVANVYMLVVFHNQTQYSIASVNGTQEEHDEIVGSFRFLD
jgi:hypothetical protein